MTAPEDAIRARRKLTNRLIAAHDAARLRPFFAPDVKLIAGDGALLTGVDAVVQAFAQQFRDPGFVTYERVTEAVALDQTGARAAEHGRWIARWKDAGGTVLTGPYLAAWRKVIGQWVIESELFVTLAEMR